MIFMWLVAGWRAGRHIGGGLQQKVFASDFRRYRRKGV